MRLIPVALLLALCFPRFASCESVTWVKDLETGRLQEKTPEVQPPESFSLQIEHYFSDDTVGVISVYRMDRQDLPSDFARDLYRFLTAARETADRYQSDSSGHCQIPRFDETSFFFVWTDSCLGYTVVDPDKTEARLTVRHYQLTRVEVVDSLDQPVADLAVALTENYDPKTFIFNDFDWQGRTDGEGIAYLFLDQRRTSTTVSAFTEVIFDQLPMVKLAADAAGILAGRLKLPPFGQMNIRVKPSPGLTLPDADLRAWAANEENPKRFWPSGAFALRAVSAKVPQLSLLVGVDETVRIQFGHFFGSYDLIWTEVGPAAAGMVRDVQLELPPGTGRFIIRGRFVNEDGKAFIDQEFRYFQESFDAVSVGGPSMTAAKTDHEGQFEFEIDVVRWRDDSTLYYRFHIGPWESWFLSELVHFKTDGPTPVELGDILLAQKPLVVAGRVVDEQGHPVAGAYLNISVHDPELGLEARTKRCGGTFESDEKGRFEYRSVDTIDHLKLEVHKKGVGLAYVPFDLGDRDLVIRLEASLLARKRVNELPRSFFSQRDRRPMVPAGPIVQVEVAGLEDLPETARVWFDFAADERILLGSIPTGPWPIPCAYPEVWFRTRTGGDFQVVLKLGLEGDEPSIWLPLREAEPFRFVVDGEAAKQKISIKLDRDEVLKTLKDLQSR